MNAFHTSKHPGVDDFVDRFQSWREAGKFTDLTLVAEDGTSFDVHKMAVAAHSKFIEESKASKIDVPVSSLVMNTVYTQFFL